jgi:acetyl-CoA carboxylase biotin carboxyl carrier protein
LAEANDKPRPFDVRTVRDLVRLMSQHDLSEIDLSEGEQRIRLRRGARVVNAPPVVLPAAVPHAGPPPGTPAPAAPAASTAPASAAKPAKKLLEIKSPSVGTFYAQREPGAPPFVTVGSRVSPSTVVCIIEAMKVYNDIQADCSGVIAEICVNNGDFVEFNTVLFRVDPG